MVTEEEDQRLPFGENDLLTILRAFRGEDWDCLESLRSACRELAQPFYRNRTDDFSAVLQKLTDVYKRAALRSILRDFPLLVVDEAHNWKNGPLAGANGFDNFAKYIAPHVRRALLLTATPFQLRPDEMLQILKVSDYIRPCSTQAASSIRCERLAKFREEVLRPVLANSEAHSRRFSQAWARIPRRVSSATISALWVSQEFAAARSRLRSLAQLEGVVTSRAVDMAKIIAAAVAGVDPDIRQFSKEALDLYSCNADLSSELGKLVIRHRRQTEHRFFSIGTEFGQNGEAVVVRSDGHILHAAPGLDIRGEAELPQFILMRCVSEMKGGKGRSSLGSDLTGCYSTLHESSEGHRVKESLKESPVGRVYLNLLFDMVNKRHDPRHPKMSVVVNEVLRHWRAGEKVLVFCFRVNTAERLRDIISEKVRNELASYKRKCLGGEAQLKTLRARLTGRDRDLVGLGLDRVLWSVAWAMGERFPLRPGEFVLNDEELTDLARISLQFGVDLTEERVDRVFLHRATEHIVAKRFLNSKGNQEDGLRLLLTEIADPGWVAEPYGLYYRGEDDERSEESSAFDERGCHTKYTGEKEASREQINAVAEALRSKRQRALTKRDLTKRQTPVLNSYAVAPSLWLGDEPIKYWQQPTGRIANTLGTVHEHLWYLTRSGGAGTTRADANAGDFDWYTRALVLQALRRALLRESVLLRLLPHRSDLHESGWGELLAQAFFANLPNQHESMAQRIGVFLEDLRASSGHIDDASSARGALYQATRLRDQQFVALVKGGGGNMIATRDRIFTGFNTPLLPEILICTQVGQEGIDLHRHCRHVVHYDLAWNPAVLEQRTGRADRIGSKTFRERAAASDPKSVRLEIGVPFLAGTYDERMYEELRIRAQTFEVLTGGDFAADHADSPEMFDGKAQGEELGLSVLALPLRMIDDLRVKLQVWTPELPVTKFVANGGV
ncbi:MAG: DEAD/DEAH box helicase [Bryobacterales bacterium]|nr:DEAD/DEAH box helicase [Bryobacterales bacterium]